MSWTESTCAYLSFRGNAFPSPKQQVWKKIRILVKRNLSNKSSRSRQIVHYCIRHQQDEHIENMRDCVIEKLSFIQMTLKSFIFCADSSDWWLVEKIVHLANVWTPNCSWFSWCQQLLCSIILQSWSFIQCCSFNRFQWKELIVQILSNFKRKVSYPEAPQVRAVSN